jgi:hypothetical protein
MNDVLHQHTTYVSNFVALGVLVVTCLELDPRFAASNEPEGDGFLRAIQIRSTAFFGGEVKLSAQCCKISRHVKNTKTMKG